MSRVLQLELPEATYAALAVQAAAEGVRPETVAIEALQEKFDRGPNAATFPGGGEEQAAQDRFERHFGTWGMGRPAGLDNEQIDADLVAEYARGLDRS